MEVSAKVESLVNETVHLLNSFNDEPRTNAILRVGYAVLEDVNRFPETSRAAHRDSNRLRVGFAVGAFDAAIALRHVSRHEYASEQRGRTPQIKSNMKTAVDVQANKIAHPFRARIPLTHQTERKAQPALLH